MYMAVAYRLVIGGRPEIYIRATSPNVWTKNVTAISQKRGAIERHAPAQPGQHGEAERREVEPLAKRKWSEMIEPGFERRIGFAQLCGRQQVKRFGIVGDRAVEGSRHRAGRRR